MDAKENFVLEDGTENVETVTTEEMTGNDGGEQSQTQDNPPKLYTEEEHQRLLEEKMSKRIPRLEAKLRKENESQYGELVRILQAGTGEQDVKKIAQSLKSFYEGRGKDMSSANTPQYSPKDTAVLAKAEADEIISFGMDEVIEETKRLNALGFENMTDRDKAVFKILADHQNNVRRNQEFNKLGVSKEVYDSDEFKNFSAMFNSDTSAEDVVKLFNQSKKPKKQIETMGSMKNSSADDGGVKDYYSYEEASKFTKADFDKNPKLFQRILECMPKWGK